MAKYTRGHSSTDGEIIYADGEYIGTIIDEEHQKAIVAAMNAIEEGRISSFIPISTPARGPSFAFMLTEEMAHAVCDVEDICFGEGLGPNSSGAIASWKALVRSAEIIACRTCHSNIERPSPPGA